MDFTNSYADMTRADAYAKLEFAGTYYLAYRDIPEIIARHVKGTRTVDFGCGTGRSTRFLQKMGLEVVGIDISENMLRKAREFDESGKYVLVEEGTFGPLEENSWDLVLAAFTFDNIPGLEKKTAILTGIRKLLDRDGRVVVVVSAPEIYFHEWVSFSTRGFAEANRNAKCGDTVRIRITDIEDSRPVEDIIWPDADYRRVFDAAGLELLEMRKTLARGDEPVDWVNETRIAPWVVYVLGKPQEARPGRE